MTNKDIDLNDLGLGDEFDPKRAAKQAPPRLSQMEVELASAERNREVRAKEGTPANRDKPASGRPSVHTPSITFDQLLFGWTRIVSYVLIAILILAGLFYVIRLALALAMPEPIAPVRLADVRPVAASPIAVDEPERPDRIRTLHGTPISVTLQKYFNGAGELGSTYDEVTDEMNYRSDKLLVALMEDFAKELEQSDLKPRERYDAFGTFLIFQSFDIKSYDDKLVERERAGAEAVTKLLVAIALSVLVSLVLVLLGIESNTRKLRLGGS